MVAKITNAQWYLLKDHCHGDFIEIPYNVPKCIISSLVRKNLIKPIRDNSYRITEEAKIAVDNMNRLTERYDRS